MSVAVPRFNPVFWLTIVTWAAGITAPLESVTVPKTVVSSLCGHAQAGSNANERTKRKHAPELKNAADQARACVRSMKERGSKGVGLWRSLVFIGSIRRANRFWANPLQLRGKL